MLAIRREDAKCWPAPWITPDMRGTSSAPVAWSSFAAAKRWIDLNRNDERQFAVYHVRGFIQKKIYPR